ADVGDDAVDPGREPRLAAKIRKPPVNPQEDVLGEILRSRPVLHGAGYQGEDQILVSFDQFLKRAFIAGTAAFDELALVDGLHVATVLEHAPGGIVSTGGAA